MAILHFRAFKPDDAPILAEMIQMLYADEAATTLGQMPQQHIEATIQTLTTQANVGDIVVFDCGGTVVGYALVIFAWSNEFGGRALLIDELLVLPEHRQKGYGRAFFDYLFEKNPYQAVVYWLEVGTYNTKAARFYEELGFKPFKTAHKYRLANR